MLNDLSASPCRSTNGSGGKNLDVEWKDDGSSPKASDWGNINIYLATGSHDVQYKLQTLDTNVAYNKGTGSYKIDADSGPSGGFYFLRFEGTAGNGTPPMAFSARFSLNGMSGTFNSTVQAQLSSSGGTASAGGAAATVTSAASSASRAVSSASSSVMARSTSTMTVSAAAARSTGNVTTSSATRTQIAGLASALVCVAAMTAAFL